MDARVRGSRFIRRRARPDLLAHRRLHLRSGRLTDTPHQLAELVARIRQTQSWTGTRLGTTVAELDALPLTRSEDLRTDQAMHPPFGTNLTLDLSEYVRATSTRGTTGTPLRWLDTAASIASRVGVWRKFLVAQRVAAADVVLHDLAATALRDDFELAVQAVGALSIKTLNLVEDARLYAPTLIVCTPEQALDLARSDLSSTPRLVLLWGAPGGSLAPLRRSLEDRLATRCVDVYAMTELGLVGVECSAQRGNLHLSADIWAERVDGELVLTDVTDTHMPLIRYCTGDLADELGQCGCGSGSMAIHGGILGRRADELVVRGKRLLPISVERIARRHPAVTQVRLRTFGPREQCELMLELEVDASIASEGDRSRVAVEVSQDLRGSLGLRIACEIVSPGALTNQPTGRRARKLSRQ